MNITADTNFLVSATQWDNSSSHKLLKNLIETNAKIFTTREILDEFTEVLQRDFKYKKEKINDIIETILAFIRLVEPKEKRDIIKDDPNDNKILECAIESKSKYIISYDKHLLNLKEYEGIRIIKPENYE